MSESDDDDLGDEAPESSEEDDELAAVLNMSDLSGNPPPASSRRASSAPLTTEALLAAVTPPPPEAPVKVQSLKRTAVMEYGLSPAPKQSEANAKRAEEDDDEEEASAPRKITLPSASTESAPPPPAETPLPAARSRKPVVAPVSSRDAVTLRPRTKRSGFWTGVLLPAAVSAGVVFAIFRWGVTPLLQKPPEQGEAPIEPPPVAALPPPKAVAPQPKTETLPLPTGIEVQNGLGLLEVEVSEPRALYINGDFVGKVLLRRAPLKPGRHQVKIGEGEDATNLSVDVTAGARTRVTLPAPPPR